MTKYYEYYSEYLFDLRWKLLTFNPNSINDEFYDSSKLNLQSFHAYYISDTQSNFKGV
jgi:hypothetical protein